MIIRKEEQELKKIDNLRGGEGTVEMQHLIQGELLKKNGKLFSKITIPKGCSIGLHDHTTDFEVYYILSGNGQVNDSGIIEDVTEGDVVYTTDGKEHDIRNIGDDDLVFIAVVVND